ncbi:MAG: hypothetical protein U0Q18_24170 [Bryobacteraceae bacterium]
MPIRGSIGLLYLSTALAAFAAADPGRWIPARWDGGPLEIARRTGDQAFSDSASREAAAKWLSPASLDLLAGTPVNCLLVTFSGAAEPLVLKQQQALVKEFARLARDRGIAVLGVVYPGSNPAAAAQASKETGLDGLVLDGDFPASFTGELASALHAIGSPASVIPIARDPSVGRTGSAAVVAVQGVTPGARNLADSGIRAGASAEPWIDSNVWLVRSFRVGSAWRPVWINAQQSKGASATDYLRSVADGAVGGGRWIVSLDDDLRVKLFRKDPKGLETWGGIARYLNFAEGHAEWRNNAPFGNLGIVVDTAGQHTDLSDEYLNLSTRRHAPYRIIPRSELTASVLETYRVVMAFDLAPPSAAERKILCDFAERGGLVLAGPSWGNPPNEESYAEVSLGKGRVAVYREDPPDAEGAAKDLADLMDPEVMGLTVFNTPSSITDVSTDASGKRVVIQLLCYADYPGERVTVRFNGNFKSARMFSPDGPVVELKPEPAAKDRTEVLIPKPARWSALILE